jgi:hypothetical protein
MDEQLLKQLASNSTAVNEVDFIDFEASFTELLKLAISERIWVHLDGLNSSKARPVNYEFLLGLDIESKSQLEDVLEERQYWQLYLLFMLILEDRLSANSSSIEVERLEQVCCRLNLVDAMIFDDLSGLSMRDFSAFLIAAQNRRLLTLRAPFEAILIEHVIIEKKGGAHGYRLAQATAANSGVEASFVRKRKLNQRLFMPMSPKTPTNTTAIAKPFKRSKSVNLFASQEIDKVLNQHHHENVFLADKSSSLRDKENQPPHSFLSWRSFSSSHRVPAGGGTGSGHLARSEGQPLRPAGNSFTRQLSSWALEKPLMEFETHPEEAREKIKCTSSMTNSEYSVKRSTSSKQLVALVVPETPTKSQKYKTALPFKKTNKGNLKAVSCTNFIAKLGRNLELSEEEVEEEEIVIVETPKKQMRSKKLVFN